MIIDFRKIFVHKEKHYFKLVEVGKFWSNNYTEYGSNGDRSKQYQSKYILILANNLIRRSFN